MDDVHEVGAAKSSGNVIYVPVRPVTNGKAFSP